MRATASRTPNETVSHLPSAPAAALISCRHERDQDPLGPSTPRQRRHARLHLGGNGVGRLAPGVPDSARPPVVRIPRLASLSGACLLLVVVRLRRVCAGDLRRGRLHRRLRRDRRRRRGDRHVGMAGTRSKRATTYGSARWAETREVREAGLLGHDGALLGRWRDQYLRHDGPEHVLCFAPTRSGKGVGLVVPTLLAWSGSAIVHDIKGENWTLTAGWRASSAACCCLIRPTRRALLQSAARGAPGRMGGPRRPEHR